MSPGTMEDMMHTRNQHQTARPKYNHVNIRVICILPSPCVGSYSRNGIRRHILRLPAVSRFFTICRFPHSPGFTDFRRLWAISRFFTISPISPVAGADSHLDSQLTILNPNLYPVSGVHSSDPTGRHPLDLP